MQFIKRNGRKWWLQLALVGLMLGSIAAVVTIDRWGHGPALAQPPAPGSPGSETASQTADTTEPALEPGAYSQVQQLREQWALTNADLAAMGLTQAQAEGVLDTVKAWYTANAATLGRRDQAVRAARTQLWEAYRRINMGPKDESLIRSVPTLQNNLVAATAARQQLIDSGLPGIEAKLGGAQRTIWQAARANAKAPTALRYASDLGGDQVEAYRKRQLRRSRELNSVDRSSPFQSARVIPGAGALPGVGATLTVSQVQQTALAKENQRLSMDGVLAAEAEVLPTPEAWRDDDLVLADQADEQTPTNGGL